MLPRIVSTKYRRSVIDPLLLQCQHRTGAGVLGGSSAVGDYHLVARQFAQARFNLVKRNRERAFHMLCFIRIERAHINNDSPAMIERRASVRGRDSARAVARLLLLLRS